VLTQPTTDQEINKVIRQGISAVQAQNYMLGLKFLSQAYANSARSSPPEGLSFYALCVAVVDRKYKSAIDLCKKAIEMQFYNPHHYANLTRIYLAAGSRKLAFDTLQHGLKIMPEDEMLNRLSEQLGRRAAPALPFLPRSNPLNEMIGRARSKKKKPAKKR
jgi:tetratricopeptide (TPR) repeat protein